MTGEPTWYASTCRECPAGCGVLAKNREERVIKVEGNPLHPVNQGKLCARGQAALQALYNPDRILKPRLKKGNRWEELEFDEALSLVQQKVQQATVKGPNRLAMQTEVVGQSLLELFQQVLTQGRNDGPLVYEPLAYESLKFAHAKVFGKPMLPSYRLDQADVLLGFGADFLETWLSPVEYSRKFKAMHGVANGQKGTFIHVSPYQSLTAANADWWLTCRPSSEVAVLLGLIQHALNKGRGRTLPTPFRAALNRLTSTYKSTVMEQRAGIGQREFEQLAHRLLIASRPLVLGSGAASPGSAGLAADLAAVLLNVILNPGLPLYDFDQRHRVEIAHTRGTVNAFWQRLAEGPVELLLLNNVNSLYSLPPDTAAAKALARDSLYVVAFSNFMDETAAAADLIFPIQLALECWDAYESKQAMVATLQPTMGKITQAPNIGDIFLQLLEPDRRSAADYQHYLMARLSGREQLGNTIDWLRMIQTGGHFVANQSATRPTPVLDGTPVAALAGLVNKMPEPKAAQILYVTPSLRFYDGRGANRPWLPEIPDPIEMVAWQTLVMVHPRIMADKGWSEGQIVLVETAQGQIQLPAYGHPGLHPEAVVIAMGQGHSQYGRYAQNQGQNPIRLLAAVTDPDSGAPSYALPVTKLSRAGAEQPLASVSGSRTQHGRKIALSVALKDVGHPSKTEPGLEMDDFPFTLPLPEGYAHQRDIYPAHTHDTYRWGMVVDLDRCIGCSACVAACYAENNVGIVGEQHIIEGREMAWIRIERYQDPEDPTRLIFLPMLCQHCDNAPCESVCPVFAPHHSKEGLNNQIYNRCIGTRFCAQNCPYKVRRFNWFDWQWPEPLNMQLNPNVTVRSKGVMEKCSFCVQRIKYARDQAKNEKRTIRDGEVIPACVQTCPTSALFFGNLMDPNSVVRKMISDPRAYQVMGYLNTKPAVIYLKKVIQEVWT